MNNARLKNSTEVGLVVVKWSASSPSTPSIRVCILLKSTIFCKIWSKRTIVNKQEAGVQCDQIWRFFALWPTIQSWWQQLFYPNHAHCQAIFVIFLVNSFWATFIDIWRFLSGHTAHFAGFSRSILPLVPTSSSPSNCKK